MLAVKVFPATVPERTLCCLEIAVHRASEVIIVSLATRLGRHERLFSIHFVRDTVPLAEGKRFAVRVRGAKDQGIGWVIAIAGFAGDDVFLVV